MVHLHRRAIRRRAPRRRHDVFLARACVGRERNARRLVRALVFPHGGAALGSGGVGRQHQPRRRPRLPRTGRIGVQLALLSRFSGGESLPERGPDADDGGPLRAGRAAVLAGLSSDLLRHQRPPGRGIHRGRGHKEHGAHQGKMRPPRHPPDLPDAAAHQPDEHRAGFRRGNHRRMAGTIRRVQRLPAEAAAHRHGGGLRSLRGERRPAGMAGARRPPRGHHRQAADRRQSQHRF